MRGLESGIHGVCCDAVEFKLANTPATTSQSQVVEWKATEALFEAKIKEIEGTTVPAQITSTVAHPGSSPVQTQPNTPRMIALGALIGFALGAMLTLIRYISDGGAPAPPRAVVG